MVRKGFTAVELLVVIIIIAILLTLSVVNVRATQVRARDSDRAADVTAIAQGLESYYQASHTNGSNSITTSYPGTNDMADGANGLAFLKERLHEKSLRSPDLPDATPMSLVQATNTGAAAAVAPAVTTTTYIYQPLQADGSLCASNASTRCRSFSIYYKLEIATPDCPAPANICTFRSVQS